MATKCPKCQSENPDDSKFCKECGTNITHPEEAHPSFTKTLETPVEELRRGTLFAGRYEIIEELGKGGMGKVYRVEDTKIHEEVALKLIKPEISSDKKTIERFHNELKLTRKIRHKNVSAMFDLGEEKGTHYITMEYVPGQDLKSLIRQTGRLAIPTVISLAKQICEGLSEAHRLGIIHRDLKPSNVIIDKQGNARIMDFGIARSLTATGITGTGVMIGTPEYMSPEQVEGKEVDQRSDIYSLGIILYEMVTGRVPFEGDTPLVLAMKHREERPPDPKGLNPQIPDNLKRIILNCLEKDGADRCQSAGDLGTELERIELGLPIIDIPAPKKKIATSKEVTVSLSARKIVIPLFLTVMATIIGLVLWQPWSKKESPPPASKKPSIAVLPFDDYSPQKDQEYLCFGLPDELITRLTQIEGLWTPARSSSFSFKAIDTDFRKIGQELNVETILEGSLIKEGTKLRITVRLVHAADSRTLWQRQYEREATEILALLDDLSGDILNELKVELLGEEETVILKRYTQSDEAYQLYIKGLFFWNKRTEEGLKSAIDLFNQAVELDRDFALAYTGIANSYNLLSLYGNLPASESFPKAKEAVLKALSRDETIAEAHTALGYIKMRYEWDWQGAEDSYLRAIELNPNYATSHFWYAEFLALEARFDEAIEEINRAIELDPVSMIINSSMGLILMWARRFDQGIEYIQKALSMNPDFPFAHVVLGLNYLYSNRFSLAISELEKARVLYRNSIYSRGYLGHAYARAGDIDRANEILEELLSLSRSTYVAPYWIAIIYEGLGDNNKALEWLEKAYQERYEMLAFLNVGPYVDGLRSDPRFEQLLKDIGFEQ